MNVLTVGFLSALSPQRTSFGFLIRNRHAPAHDISVQTNFCRHCKTTLIGHPNNEADVTNNQFRIVCLEWRQEDLKLDQIPYRQQAGTQHKNAFCADVLNKARSGLRDLIFDRFESDWCAQLISNCCPAFNSGPHHAGADINSCAETMQALPDAEDYYETKQRNNDRSLPKAKSPRRRSPQY
jgi:hypothetical protein